MFLLSIGAVISMHAPEVKLRTLNRAGESSGATIALTSPAGAGFMLDKHPERE
jgi:hypothetical protein